MAGNKNLHAANKAKKDEFYTQLVDIENELKHYKQHFKDKVVLCNCDDPRVSNFFHYFSYNFEQLGLKKLITTCYKSQERDLFSQNNSERAIWLEYFGDKNNNCVPDPEEIGIHYFKGDGDFRSAECIELLKEADIVVTNPPFSLFREYVAQLMKYEKKFVIVGHQNAITYKEIFPLIKNNEIWLGYGFKGGAGHFISKYEDTATAGDHREGMIRVSGVNWFTNLEIQKRHEDLILYKSYSPEEYPAYDNYDAINVNKTSDIPADFFGMIGVPITFLDKYNPEQFEIMGITQRNDDPFKTKKYTIADYPNANDLNARGVIIVNGIPKTMYARILIRRRQPSASTYPQPEETTLMAAEKQEGYGKE
ncbi:MAG: adenine-specific methyltransferase EcoRI family protein [Paludibacteraceae bacterium]|nr:adenine-specific methyltransferase EcoRI family protein [Paludibacteraceae bacterium]